MKVLVITLLNFMISNIMAYGNGGDDYKSKANIMIDNGEKYHKNVNIIRKMHPKFMIHKRDEALHKGVRSEEHSLKACVNCHGDNSGNTVRVDSKGQFCADCHKKVAVSIDCFGCHRAIIGDSQ